MQAATAATAATYIISYLQQIFAPQTAKEITKGIAEMYGVAINIRTVYRTLKNYCALCQACCIVNTHKSYYRNQPITKFQLNKRHNETNTFQTELENCPPCPSCE